MPSRSAPPRAELTKVANLKESAIVLMKAFLFDASEYKEKNFTPVVSKVLKLKAELLNSPNGELVQELTHLSAHLSTAKKLIRPLKDFTRTGKQSTLEAMTENLMCIQKFALSLGIEIGAELGPAWVKASFFMKCRSEVSSGLEFLKSWPFTWATGGNADKVPLAFSPASLIKHCVFVKISNDLRKPLPEADGEWDALKQNLLGDARGFVELVRNLEACCPELAGAKEVLQAYLNIALAACSDPGVAPAEVAKAKKLLDSSVDAVQVREGLGFAGVGAAMQSDSDAIVVKGALDDQCDDDYRLLLEAFFSSGMPSAQQEHLTITIEPKVCIVDSQTKRAMMPTLLAQFPRRLQQVARCLVAQACVGGSGGHPGHSEASRAQHCLLRLHPDASECSCMGRASSGMACSHRASRLR